MKKPPPHALTLWLEEGPSGPDNLVLCFTSRTGYHETTITREGLPQALRNLLLSAHGQAWLNAERAKRTRPQPSVDKQLADIDALIQDILP